MPAQPAGDRLGGGIDKEDALPWDEHVVEPHLAVELVKPTAERGDKSVAVARRDLAAQRSGAGRIDRHDKAGAMLADIDAREPADIDILGIGRARMHAELAADDDPGIALAHQFERDAAARVRAHSLADNGGAAAIGEEPAGAGDQLAIRHR